MKMERNIRIIIVCLILAATFGCSRSSNKVNEVVFAPTEVGAPQGDKVTQTIGPAGGAISSADGRLTITVPPNALSANVMFSIQPITNKSDGGVGLAYRLEPSGKVANSPIQLSFHYSDQDLTNTLPDALRLSYQDEKGAWHQIESVSVDETQKLITISTTHLSDWAPKWSRGFTYGPMSATVRVGEQVRIRADACEAMATPSGDRINRCRVASECQWTLKGEGTLSAGDPPKTYTAPAKKPYPNHVTVTCFTSYMGRNTGYTTDITIMDRQYRATGMIGAMKYDGLICSFEKPFTIDGDIQGFPMHYRFNFMPSSGTEGRVDLAGYGHLVTAEGGEPYSVEGLDTDHPRIKVTGQATGHSPVGSITKGSTVIYELVPLDRDECAEHPQDQKRPLDELPPANLGGKGPL